MLAKPSAVVALRYKGVGDVNTEDSAIGKRKQRVWASPNKQKCGAWGVKQQKKDNEGNTLIHYVESMSWKIGKLLEYCMSASSIPAIINIIEQIIKANLKAEIKNMHSSIDKLKQLVKVTLPGCWKSWRWYFFNIFCRLDAQLVWIPLSRAFAHLLCDENVLIVPNWPTPDILQPLLVGCLQWDTILFFHEPFCPWMTYLVSVFSELL